jgi:hypothetical protein
MPPTAAKRRTKLMTLQTTEALDGSFATSGSWGQLLV